jgi:two-component system KDP operon response regulator KdpE
MTEASVLVVEDNRAQQRVLINALTVRGYDVSAATSGAEALRTLDADSVDLVILDLGLPDVDGLDLFRHIKLRVSCPVIVVTADSDEGRIVAALDLGADDYVTKPFSMPVLLARLRVALRAHGSSDDARVLGAGDIRVDLDGHQVMLGDQVVEMHSSLVALLAVLIRHQGKVLTYSALDRALGGEPSATDRTLHRVAISKLRRQIGAGPRRPTIETEYDVGYRLVVPNSDDQR